MINFKHKNHKKAIMKTISWNLISSTLVFIIASILNIDLSTAGSLALINMVIKPFIMFGHELMWQGKCKKVKEGEINGKS